MSSVGWPIFKSDSISYGEDNDQVIDQFKSVNVYLKGQIYLIGLRDDCTFELSYDDSSKTGDSTTGYSQGTIAELNEGLKSDVARVERVFLVNVTNKQIFTNCNTEMSSFSNAVFGVLSEYAITVLTNSQLTRKIDELYPIVKKMSCCSLQ